MEFSFGIAFASLLVIWFVGSMLGTKTGGKFGAPLFATFVLLACFWTDILPKDIIATAQLPAMAKLSNLIIAVGIATTIEPRQLKQDWRLIVTVLAGIVGMGVLVLGICSVFFGKQEMIAVFPVLVGGLISANTMINAATAKGLETIAALATLFFSLQSLFGLPLVSIGTSLEAKRLLKQYREHGSISGPKGGALHTEKETKEAIIKTPVFARLPKEFQTPLYPLVLVVVIGTIADVIGTALNGPTQGILGTTSMSLILGFAAAQVGLIHKDPVKKSGLSAFLMFVMIMNLRASLAKVSLAAVISYLPMILTVFVLAAVGMLLVGGLVGKIFGYSFGMVMAFCFGCYAGYPLNYSAAMDAVDSLAKTPEEHEMLEKEIVNRVVLGGVIGVTIASVVIGSVFANLL